MRLTTVYTDHVFNQGYPVSFNGLLQHTADACEISNHHTEGYSELHLPQISGHLNKFPYLIFQNKRRYPHHIFLRYFLWVPTTYVFVEIKKNIKKMSYFCLRKMPYLELWYLPLNLNKRAMMALYLSPDYQTSFKSVGLSVQEKKSNIEFQDGGHGCDLGFLIRTFLAIFELEFISILPTEFRVKWSFS